MRRSRALFWILALVLFSVQGGSAEDGMIGSFSFGSLDGATYESWGLLGTPLVINVGSHF